jgi:16S rRNA (guanine527-N7)-methyltransferase
VDVGSGGGSPGLPVAEALPDRLVTLLDAERKKCEFLRRFAAELPNVAVVWGRAEQQEPESYGAALAKALAKPPVAAELTLPLVAQGGAAILWTGASADLDEVRAAAEHVGGRLETAEEGLVVLRKVGPTPPGFPRKPGLAKKRPLAP